MVTAPKIALIGRTNVGKSSLFNKMVEEQKSLVSEVPGTTRDRFEADCIWRAQVMRLVDTGGLNVDIANEIERNVVEQANIAIVQADLIFFVVDLMVGPTVEDIGIAKKLMAAKKAVIVVGNKADKPETRARVDGRDWLNWPLMKPLAVSAKQGSGIGDLLDAAYKKLIDIGKPPVDVSDVLPMRVAVIGEPNVGKSTLLNSILGEERFITANVPHTTREPNDAAIVHNGRTYHFIDTAGVRKMARVREAGTRLEQQGVERTLKLLDRTDVALFVIDVKRGITAQDKHLAGTLAESGVSVIIVANKWDLVEDKTPTLINKFEDFVRTILPQLKYAPIIFTSALNDQRTKNLFELVDITFQSRFTQLTDEEAKSFISRAIVRHKPSRGKGVKHPRIIKFVQTRANPPTFNLVVNLSRKDSLAISYVRFLENLLREHYNLTGTPVRIRVSTGQKSHTTYAPHLGTG